MKHRVLDPSDPSDRSDLPLDTRHSLLIFSHRIAFRFHCLQSILDRGDPTVIIFLNNAIYGMTGGQLAPTSLMGQVTSTSLAGRNVKDHGYPIVMTEALALQEGCSFAVRTSVHDAPSIRKTKKYIRQAFLNQAKNKSLSVVEVVSACPSGWRLDPVDAHKYLVEHLFPVYKPGVIKEPPGGMPR